MEAIGNAIHQSIRTSIQSALAVGRIEKLTVALKDPIFSACYFFLCFGQETTDANYPLLTASLLYDNFLVGDAMNTCCSAILRGCDLWNVNRWRSSPMSRWLRRPPLRTVPLRYCWPSVLDTWDHRGLSQHIADTSYSFKWRAWTLNALR